MPRRRWIEYDGRTLTLRGWARQAGLAAGTLWDRIDRRGLPMERALATGVMDKRTCALQAKRRG